MTPDAIYKELETYVNTNWTATKLTFEEVPAQDGQQPTEAESWVRFSIRVGPVSSLELGQLGQSIRHGNIMVNVFTPQGQMRQGATYAGQIETLFRRKSINGVQCYDPETRYIPNQKDKWLNHLVTIPFTALTGG